jgi:hypothetical protein
VAAYDPDRMTGQPEGVRVVIAGREIPCDMLRAPDQDYDGLAVWVAVPRVLSSHGGETIVAGPPMENLVNEMTARILNWLDDGRPGGLP